MTQTTKRRALSPVGGMNGYIRFRKKRKSTGQWEVQAGFPSTGTSLGVTGTQVTTSEGHNWPPNPGESGDIGGDFSTTKQYARIPVHMFTFNGEADASGSIFSKDELVEQVGLRCPFESSLGKPSFPASVASTPSALDPIGAKAISLVRPTAAEVDLSTALGELLREGLPAIVGANSWQERTLRARNAGDEYLNVEFGWAPLVSDVQGFGRTLVDADKIVGQYQRDQGRTVRRRYQFPVSVSEKTEILSTNKQPERVAVSDVGGFGISSGGIWSKTTKTTINRWFSGAFCYGSPLRGNHVEGSATLAEKADRLFGLSLSPDVLWNLTPWSWATDWALNTGDILSYASDVATQGLVMRYGYMMEHSVASVEYRLDGAIRRGRTIPSLSATFVTETKQRRGANPFGFGITWDGLSTAQGAILAALGISRTR